MTFKKINNLILILATIGVTSGIASYNISNQVVNTTPNQLTSNTYCNNIRPTLSKDVRSTLRTFIDLPNNLNNCIENTFVSKQNLIKLKILSSILSFNQLPVKNFSIEKDKWLFRKEQLFDDIQTGKKLLTQQELMLRKESLIKRAKYYKDNNIKYILIHTPFKNSIYSEQKYKDIGYASYTILDQMKELIDPIKEEYNIGYYNLKSELLSKKTENRLFFTNDSHWNYEGMKYAYSKYYDYLTSFGNEFSNLTPINKLSKTTINYQGDIPRILGIPEYFEDKNQLKLIPIKDNTILSYPNNWIKTINGETIFHEQFTNKNNSLPRLSIYGDSYTDIMRPILAQDYSSLNYYKNTYPGVPDEVYQDKPNVVLELFNEGYLGGIL
jgi:SGNH hydrolase-like domain, acetyltransferase AlgX